jgi:ferredoxin-type protein NapG
VAELEFLAGCTRCGECIAACPYQAIRVAPPRYGPAAGTPVIEADVQACWMCVDFPCISSCEPQVLLPQPRPVMGVARITELLCLAYHGTGCTVCSERCPVPGAIALSSGRPTIRDDACTGCGVCRYVCPAPENAVLLLPALHRPARSELVAASRPLLSADAEPPGRPPDP